ncbi:5-hydroxyisourate hydrolase-like isoform X2 [Lingula anatina]|uniref:5-hydroxyisourate hydrolase n=1 Tax=Lingula anatina TaxID=7574 RepID=A0A1S3K3K8_LINAN|nr:5-hydroxyisourate hydrolase-like isoform X2 [Lingula anatina]|eukprot:XP_013417218.1 5-hydroxyisourate hydrolase-like isoform X2 [Lingula anatina]
MSKVRLEVLQKHLTDRCREVNPAITMSGNPLTTHVLDTARGSPAANLELTVSIKGQNGQWTDLITSSTNSDGRVPRLLTQDQFVPGTYKINFNTGGYFQQLGVEGFYPYVEVVFEIRDPQQHYHVPLLLSPYGYSTYRGS